MSAARIHLIRHGETPGNAARVVQTPDTPLSERGSDQAERLARRFAGAPIGLVLASDLRRAAQTAECLATAIRAPLVFEPLLQERNFGDLRGTPYSELNDDLFAPDFAPPGGETWSAFDARVARAWLRIGEVAARCEGELVVVTHGLVCRAIARQHVAREVGSAEETALVFANTSVTVLRGPEPWAVELFACTAHLEEQGGSVVKAGAPA